MSRDEKPGTGVMQALSGRMVDVRRFTADDAVPGDIFKALSHLCRFNGHVSRFYSVAQHSVLVSTIAQRRAWFVDPPSGMTRQRFVVWCALWGLLHDAHEAYLGDVIAPHKPLCGTLFDAQWAIDERICDGFGCPWPIHDQVRQVVNLADGVARAIERRELLAPVAWPGETEPGEHDRERLVGVPDGPVLATLDSVSAERAMLLRALALGAAWISGELCPEEHGATCEGFYTTLWGPGFRNPPSPLASGPSPLPGGGGGAA